MAEAGNDRQNRRNEPPKTLGESRSDAGHKHCEPAHELDAVLNALAEPVIIYDALGAIRKVNRAFTEFFGFDPVKGNRETLLTRIKMLNRDGQAVTLDKLPSTRALRGEVVVGERYSFVDAHGQRILAETSSVPIFSDGAVVGAVSILHNITERQRAVEDARESRRQVIDILESISDGFLALDSLWRVTYVNKRAQELLNIGGIEVLFKSLWERLPNAQVLRLYKELNHAAETKTATSFEEFIPSLDKWFEFHIYPYEHGISVYFSDITERKRAEDELRESKERVRVKLESILSPEGGIGDLELRDIIDAPALQSLVDDLYKIAKLPIGIIDLKGKVLVGTGWQDICTKFHRAHPETCKSCTESDLELTRGIPAGEFKLYKCKNGMWDAATPILVGGQHMGNLFWGQFFFEDEPIDREFFRAQARHYGFDEEKYLAALESAPRISRETLNVGMDFYLKFATMLSKLSYSNIKLARSLAERDALTASLRESQELMRAVITASPLPILTLDRDGNVLMWNKAAERIFGWSDEEVLGRPLPIVPEDKLGEARTLREQTFQGESITGVEVQRRKKDGTLIDVSISTAPLYDAEDRVSSIMAVVADVTERKLTEEERMQLANSMRLLLESTDEGIHALDLEGRCTLFNRAAAKMTGYAPEEVLGKDLHELIHHSRSDGSPYPKEECPIYRSLLTGQGVRLDNEVYWRKDGTSFPVEYSSYPIIEKGTIKGAVVTFTNITRRKRVEKALRESEELYRSLVETSPDAITATDLNGTIIMVNEQAERLFGAERPEQLIGINAFELVAPKDRKRAIENTKKVLETGVIRNVEYTLLKRDGTPYPVELSASVIGDEEGKPMAFISVLRDITERKQAKELSDALNDINAVVTSTLDVDKILQRVVVEAAKAIGCESTAIFMREDDSWTASYLFGFPQEFIGRRFSGDEVRAVELVAETGTLFISNDAYNDARLNRKIMEQYTIRSTLVIPLIVKGEVLGTLSFYYRTTPKAFTEAQIDFANKLATSISLALGNARLYEAEVNAQAQARSELEISNLFLKAADALAMHVTLSEVLNSLADIIIEATQRGRVSISLIDSKTGELQVMALRGEPEIQIGTRLMLDRLVPGFKEELMKEQTVIFNFEAPDIPKQARQLGARLNAKNVLLVPLVRAHNIIGIMGVDDPGRRATFNQREIEIVKGIADQAVVAIENAKLYEAERNIADTLQEALITMPDRIDGVEFGHLYRSATEAAKVGGDFYDLFALEHGKVGILVGDVAGKGLDAAALTSVVKNTVKAHAYEDGTPATILSKTNDLVAKISSPGEFVTMIFGVLDMTTGTLTYCSAGHPPAMIKRKEGGVELLGKHSPMIGAFSGMHYRSDKAVLNKDDVLVLYTDGLIEARCNRGFFGEERLVTLLANSGPIPAKELPRLLIDTITECAGGKLADDTAILAVSLQNR